jgi:hypothetical protein
MKLRVSGLVDLTVFVFDAQCSGALAATRVLEATTVGGRVVELSGEYTGWLALATLFHPSPRLAHLDPSSLSFMRYHPQQPSLLNIPILILLLSPLFSSPSPRPSSSY